MVKLYRSLYNFKASYSSALSFKDGDLFVELSDSGSKQDRNWYFVCSSEGQAGYVPRNYMTTETSLSSAETFALLNEVLSNLNNNKQVTAADKNEVGDKLEALKRTFCETLATNQNCGVGGSLQKSQGSKDSLSSIKSSKKRAAPLPPKDRFSSGSETSPSPRPFSEQSSQSPRNSPRPSGSSFEIIPGLITPTTTSSSSQCSPQIRPPPLLSVARKFSLTKMSADDEIVTVVYKQPPEDCHSKALELVDLVRRKTDISHEATQSLLQSILHSLVASNKDLNVLVPSLQNEFRNQLFDNEKDIQSSHDYTDLVNMFDELTKMKEDDQQRNWMLYEDEDNILRNLHSLCSTLQNASQDVCLNVLSKHKYFYVQNLVEYFQMETRWSIRKLLIETYTIMCSLDRNIVSLMLVSVLPLELAQDMFDNSEDAERLKHCCVLLTVLFSLGEAVPIHYKEKQLGGSLVTFLLGKVEQSSELEPEEDLADTFMGLLASYNLQFGQSCDNLVLQSLGQASTAKIFTEKLLLLLNREDDPAEIIGPRTGLNSIHKLVLDVFSTDDCISHFYTNDLMVLIDIIARQLADLGPGIERYISNWHLALPNTSKTLNIIKLFTYLPLLDTPTWRWPTLSWLDQDTTNICTDSLISSLVSKESRKRTETLLIRPKPMRFVTPSPASKLIDYQESCVPSQNWMFVVLNYISANNGN